MREPRSTPWRAEQLVTERYASPAGNDGPQTPCPRKLHEDNRLGEPGPPARSSQFQWGMKTLILLEGVSPNGPEARLSGSAALDLAEDSLVTLQFAIAATESPEIDAIRHARRAMLREEWTLGRAPDEPSLEEAVFSPVGVVWVVPADQQAWCLQKMGDLAARADRALEALLTGKGLPEAPKQA